MIGKVVSFFLGAAACFAVVYFLPFLFVTPMIDHTSFSVKNYDESVRFYDETLKVLGYDRVMSFENVALYGKGFKPSFSISDKGNPQEKLGNARGVHVAFSAPNRKAVDAWYAKALEMGGTDNGVPGLRPEYHKNYYAAFIIDPNGWRIEAVCHR